MIDIKKLISEGEKLEYKGQSVVIKPLTVREQSKFAQMQKDNKMQEASEFLFVTALKKADDKLTDDEILSIDDREFIDLVTKAILKVNGLTASRNFQEEQPIQETQ